MKGMVCDRCIQVVAQAMTDLGLEVRAINLGSVTVVGVPNLVSIKIVEKVLAEKGFEVIDDRDTTLTDNVKRIINELLGQDHVYEMRLKYSRILSEKLAIPYEIIKAQFLYIEGVTLEKYVIDQRLEKAKEFLVYTNFTLTEIAYLLGFSSLQHFSSQFKDMTGLTPSYFRKIKASNEQIATHNRKNND